MANVLLFGLLPDVLGTRSLEIELGEQTQTINDLLATLTEKGPEWKLNLNPEKLQNTVNPLFADPRSSIKNTDKIAFISMPGTV